MRIYSCRHDTGGCQMVILGARKYLDATVQNSSLCSAVCGLAQGSILRCPMPCFGTRDSHVPPS